MIQDATRQILALGPEALVICVLIACGYTLKRMSVYPNRLIPVAVIALGAVLYPLITDPGKAPPNIRHPVVREVMIGLLLGFMAWMIHDKGLKRLENKLPWLKEWLNNHDKPDES